MSDPDVGFADIYDVIYGTPAEFLDTQVAFLNRQLAQTGRTVLDAGCGTGRHIPPLYELGYEVVGLDFDPAMLRVTGKRLAEAGCPSRLVRGDLKALPFRSHFDAAICLESPLAYLLLDDDLVIAVNALHRVLRPQGILVVDVFDYPAALGETEIQPQATRFRAPWGWVDVEEMHCYERAVTLWHMTQRFTVRRQGRTQQFAVVHRLRIRSADDYASALESAGFTILDLRLAYPSSPTQMRGEKRMIFTARKS